MIPVAGTQKPESNAKKWRKIHYALAAGGGARCYNRGQTEPGSVLGSPIWEMSGKIATFHACGIFGERHSFASVLNHRKLRAGVTVYGVG
jgi:hypothetical protein